MVERLAGEMTTLDTRHDSHEEVDKKKRERQVLEVLTHPMTAQEVAIEMYLMGYTRNTDRNNAAPRLTELAKDGRVEIIGKTRCKYSGRTVSVYRRM